MQSSKKKVKNLKQKIKNEHFIILFFSVLSVAGIAMSGLSFSFVADQAINRFIRNGLMVLALIIPVKAGMGLNFSITVGAMIAQGVLISAVGLADLDAASFSMVVVVSIILSVLVGYFIGRLLNMVRGKEMICSIIIGFLANSIYQMIFMVGFGSFIPVKNSEILLSKGVGVRNMIDLQVFRNTLEGIWSFNIGRIHIPLFMIVVVILFSLMINYVLNTRFGQKLRAVGLDYQKASSIGIDSDSIRIKAIIISTVMASIGHLFYLQNIGMLNVYTGHLKIDIFSCAALLAGGASINDAKVRNALLGLLLFHTLFIVSPQAGQNVFNNSSLGEYFRSFVAYGTIAFALIVNLKENAAFDKGPV